MAEHPTPIRIPEPGDLYTKNGFWFSIHKVDERQVYYVRGRVDEPPIDENDLNALLEHRSARRTDIEGFIRGMEGAEITEAAKRIAVAN